MRPTFQVTPATFSPRRILQSLLGRALAEITEKFRIGIAWQGNPDHQADVFRSVPLKSFEVLADIPNLEIYSLQSGFGTEQLSSWKGSQPIRRLGDNIDKTSGPSWIQPRL